MTENDLLLSQFQPEPEVVRKQTRVDRSRFSCIDAHNHLIRFPESSPGAEQVDRLVEMMDACNVQAVFDVDGNLRMPFEDVVGLLKRRHPGRFYTLVALPWEQLIGEGDDFGKQGAAMLRGFFDQGADGLKMHKTMGLRLRDKHGKLVHYDDDRLEPLFDVCAEYDRPCLFHIADPIAFFKPLTPSNERWEELQWRPGWHFHGPEYPSFNELIEVQDRFVAKYPDVKFQSAHMCSYAEDLVVLGELLDRHPNLCCDMSARIGELGRVPRAARDFLIRYQDRVLFGMDVWATREQYAVHFRFLETDDEFFSANPKLAFGQGRWYIYGVHLPDEALRKIYADNAIRLYGQPRSS